MNKLILAAIIIIGLGTAYYFLYHYNYNEAKDTMSLVMPDMLAYAQPNITNNNKEELSKAIQELLKESEEKNPEGKRLSELVEQTEEARKSLPLIEAARSPVQFNLVNDTGKGNMLDVIPFTKPGQIYIDIRSGSGKLNIANNHSDWIPLSWKGNILFDGGTDQKSIGGHGWDRFIMDCADGTPWGVTVQKDSESGLLEVSTYANEVDENGKRLPQIYPLGTLPYGQTEETGQPYGMISISDVCPEPNKQP